MGKRTPNRLWGALAAVLAALAVIFFVVRGMTGNEEHYQVRRVVPLPSGELMLVQRMGMENNTGDRARLVRVDRAGSVKQIGEDVRGALRFLALTGDRAWFESYDEGLHQRTVTDLQIVSGTKAALDAHSMLAKGFDVLGTANGRLVLKGRDGKHYTLSSSHSIEQHGRDFDFDRLPPREFQNPDFGRVAEGSVARVGDQAVTLSQVDLLKPKAVLDQTSGEPLTFDDPPSALAYSIDFEGNGGSAILSRVHAGSKIGWSVVARDAVGPIQWEGEPGFPIRWVEQTDDATLTMLVEITSWYRSHEGDQWGVFEPHLIELDAKDGSVRSARALHIVES